MRARRRAGRAREELAELEARNAGKPIGDARGEMEMVVDTFRYYAGAPERLLGDTIPVAGGQAFTVREPLGVVGLIVPVELPAGDRRVEARAGARGRQHGRPQAGRADAADRAALRRARREAGIPDGVVNVVAGPGQHLRPAAGRAPRRGQDRVHRLDRGRALDRRRRAATIKRVTLELGGKSPNVIFADADLEAAAAAAPMAVFGNAGQDCCARSRILVQASALDEFMEALERAVRAIRVGDPLDQRRRWAR